MTKLKLFLTVVIMSGLLWSCDKIDEMRLNEVLGVNPTEEGGCLEMKEATFGPQTGHPFAMDNVIKAFRQLDTKVQGSITEEEILPTDMYVRFMPANEKEQDLVKSIPEVEVYQYPLDCEVTSGFVGANNPYMLDGFPQYWCIVPVDFDFSEVACAYEIESWLWKPSFLEEPETKGSENDFERALYEELCLEQGIEMELPVATKATKYYPSGYVKYEDTELGVVGIEGMEVDAFNFWHNYKAYSTNTGYLNYGGHYFTSSYKYRVKFEREHFAVKNDGEHVDMEFVTELTTSIINQFFTGIYARYSVLFQAAERYYFQDIDIPRPPYNGTWQTCLRICVYPHMADMSGQGLVGKFSVYEQPILADRPLVYIWDKDQNGYRRSDEYYTTAIHELTHAMHFGFDPQAYKTIDLGLQESLSRGVERYLTQQRYSVDNQPEGDYDRGRYTGIMRDLTDGEKNVVCNVKYNGNGPVFSPKSYHDSIDSAYTFAELIEAIKTCNTPLEWKTRIKDLYPGRVSDIYLDNAFNFWFE